MWDEIVKLAISNGLFALLFVFLLAYQLKDSAKRESKYQDTIKSLGNSLEVVEEIHKEVAEIGNIIKYEKRGSYERNNKNKN